MKGPEKKNRKIHGSRGNFPSTSTERKPFSFYKLILQPNIQSKKLRIPEMFARTYGDELSTAVILTVPSQESWKVELVKEDNKLWFHDGWEDFVECYSIGFAHFLQFIYEGNSRFEVHIFDKTACEICYRYNSWNSPQDQKEPRDDHRSQQRFLQKKHVDNDISVETSDVIKLEIEDEPALDKNDEQAHDDDDDDFNSGFSASDDEKINQCEGNQHNAEANDSEQRNLYEDHVWSKHEEALALVGFSKPHNPFFVVVVRERHLKRACLVYVPAHFAQANLWCRAGKFVELEASDGRRWSVRCNKACRGCNLGAGWIHFTRDNNLKAGDVCIFELIDANTYIMKVHVFKKSQMQSELLD